MKKYILIIPFFLLLVVGILTAQFSTFTTLENRWKKVEELAEKQLPESALKEVEELQLQAHKENNTSEIIKALLYKIRFSLEKDPDKAAELIKEFEEITVKTRNVPEKALLLSITAELYYKLYQSDAWNVDKRTEVSGFVPEESKEWTTNIYIDKITQLLDSSLFNASILQKQDVLKYEKLLHVGEDSKDIQPTLFDFLAYRKVEILTDLLQRQSIKQIIEKNIINTFDSLLFYHKTVENISALVYAELRKLNFLYQQNEKSLTDEGYLNALNELEKKYAQNEAMIEILYEKANYYLSLVNDNNDKTAGNKRVAYELIEQGLKKYPQYKRIALLENVKKQITQKSVSVSHNIVLKSQSEIELNIKTKNLKNIHVNIYRLDGSAQQYLAFIDNRKHRESFPNRSLTVSKELKIGLDPNFLEKDTLIRLKTPLYGIYEVNVTDNDSKNNNNEISSSFYVVTDLAAIHRSDSAKSQSWYVLNRNSGFQQAKVKATVYERKWLGNDYGNILQKEYFTNKEGYLSVDYNRNYNETVLVLENGEDKYYSTNSYAYFRQSTRPERMAKQLQFFTDRSLYRPGQTVYFKGIAYYSNKNRNEIIENENIEVVLKDANNQTISTKKFNTNEVGSFAGEFVLPQGGLNGEYTIKSALGVQSFWVEEYKRPTFEVKIEKPATEIKFGEKVNLNGSVKAFAGFDIANAQVKYRVIRNTYRLCWWINEPETELLSGTTTTDATGKFSFTFVPEKTKTSNSTWRGQFYNYRILTEVTNSNGETQLGENDFSVGDKSLFIVASVPQKIEKNTSIPIDIIVQTLNDEILSKELVYEVYTLKERNEFKEDIKPNEELVVKDKVLEGTYNSADKTLILLMNKFTSGEYKLILKTKDAWGNEVKSEHVFTLYSNKDARPPIKTYVWLIQKNIECAVGEKAVVRFGTSAQNTHVLVELLQGNKILESNWMTISNAIKSFKIFYKESYGAGVRMRFTFVKNEKFFTQELVISRKIIEKKLSPTFSVFRDKLQPGEKAEWTITIPELKNDKKQAEILVGMYDASLDQIRPHSWNFSPIYRENVLFSPTWSSTLTDSKTSDYFESNIIFNEWNEFKFNYLNWFGLEIGRNNYGGTIRRNLKLMSSQSVGFASDKKMETDALSPELMQTVSPESMEVIANDIQSNPTKVRTNFNETAFFYPQLRTDIDGNVKFSFTVPESLTRWNIKMLAHTKDLQVGATELQVVTQKEVMVQMNLPRFLRKSDKLTLTANVINLSKNALQANVHFEMIDPASEKVIHSAESGSLTLDKKNGSELVSFDVSHFSSYNLVVCKMVVRAGDFSDGEQKYLAVLPDKVLVTESMPLIIRSNQTRNFTFESLLKNASKVETQGLSLEFSSQPAWYAVQALPTLSAPENENALDYFTAYYVNTLAGFIANSHPKLANTFDQWKNSDGSREALLSNLQKNSELKNMLLEETPWVMAAKDETEQKQQIALLFDINRQKNKQQHYLEKLIKLQTANGGFSWFDGMPESRYITLEIMLNLGRLSKLTNDNALKDNNSFVGSAINYLDTEIAKDFALLKKNNKNYLKQNSIGNIQLFYLHTRTEYSEIPISEAAREAVKFYTVQSEKYWTSFSLYGKAMMSVVANRNGNTKIAREILKSLKENALKTDEFGMFWARNSSGYSWNERPIAVQAAIIEAFSEISSQPSDIDEMKIWLLKQKQTQRWDSPLSTIDAIYALLMKGSEWLNENGSLTIKVGGKLIQPTSTEAGTRYFKHSFSVNEINNETSNVMVSTIEKTTSDQRLKTENKNSGIGWGAMYWQYYQELDKVENQGGPLKISKKLFVIRSNKEGVNQQQTLNAGSAMIPIEQTSLKKGDKVITRLVITTDRNLEFVSLKDLRAACFEPVNQRSGTEWKEGVSYYQTTKDASTQFFFTYLPKGTYVFEYEMWTNNSGTFTSGIASVQCQYAPEFVSHTGGKKLKVE